MTKSEIIKELQAKLESYMSAYFAESERNGTAPTQNEAVNVATAKLNQLTSDSKEWETLSVSDRAVAKNQLKNITATQTCEMYKESMKRSPRKVDKEYDSTPQATPENKGDFNTAFLLSKDYMKASLQDRIKAGVEFATPLSKEQASQFISETVDEAVSLYGAKLSNNDQNNLREQLRKYKSILMSQVYEPQAEIVKVQKAAEKKREEARQAEKSAYKKSYADKIPVAAGVSEWAKTNISFSGCDMVVSAEMKTTNGTRVSVTIGSLQTLSYSIYRQLSAVKNIGNINAKDYVGGPRTIAGSMVFTVLNQHWGTELMTKFSDAEGYKRSTKILMDEIAPVDITVSMANEYGVCSRLAIYGVRFFSEGQVMSINDIYTENTFQYVALNLDYLVDINSKVDLTTKDSDVTIGNGTPPPIYASIQPIEDGGQKVEESGIEQIDVVKSSNSQSVVTAPDGTAMDLNKYSSRTKAILALDANRSKADEQIPLRVATSNDEAVKAKNGISKRYNDAKTAIDAYYKDKETQVPEEVKK